MVIYFGRRHVRPCATSHSPARFTAGPIASARNTRAAAPRASGVRNSAEGGREREGRRVSDAIINPA